MRTGSGDAPIRVAYVGPGLSGQYTSIDHVLRAHGVATRRCADEPVEFTTSIRGARATVVVSRFAPTVAYPSGALDLASPVREGVERVCAADGIVFVLDSQPARMTHNAERLDALRRDLAARARDVDAMPVVFQANKRDLASVVPMNAIRKALRTVRCDFVESIATKGGGTLEAFRLVLERVMAERSRPSGSYG